MKYFRLILVLIAIIAAFFFFNKKVSESDVQKMLKDDFNIEVNFCGCFGCGTEKVNVYTQNDKRWLKFTFNLPSDHPESRVIEFSSEKEKQFSILLFDAIRNQEKGGCTTDAEYKIESRGLRYKFIDGRCLFRDFFNQIAFNNN